MGIRLLVMDLDDTLLNEKNQISSVNRQAIQAVQEAGVMVTVATGRMFASAWPLAKSVGIRLPVITYNGAMVKNGQTGEVLFHRPIPEDVAGEVLRVCREKGWYVQNYVDDRLYVREMDAHAKYYTELAGVEAVVVGDDLYDMLERPTKMLMVAEPGQEEKMYHFFQERFEGRLAVTMSKTSFVELSQAGVNKGTALEFMGKRLALSANEIMAVGDSLNDMEMLRYAGLGVAMGNARKELQEAADWITLPNNQDGVAAAIEKFILNN